MNAPRRTRNGKTKKAKIEALGKLTAMASVGGASASTGDTAAMNEIADVTKRREIPVITGDAFREYWRNFKKRKYREPFPSEAPTLAQVTVPLEILRNNSCYVDFAL